jgi:uncharacterized protein DUF397
MAVRESWFLAFTWRRSSYSGNDADCVQVARYESSYVLPDEPVSASELPPDQS